MKTELSEKQGNLLRFIYTFIKRNGFPPTIREIAAEFHVSIRAAYDQVGTLKKKNKIRIKDRTSRSIELVDLSDDFFLDTCINIPILGYVAAGTRVCNEEFRNSYIPIHSSLLKRSCEYFALKVKGNSMTGIGVMDGDTIIVEKKGTANNGDVVVVEIEEGRTLKKYYKQKTRIKLLSENPNYPPLYSTDVRILGQLAGVYRCCN